MKPLAVERLREVLHYDLETGEFTWRIKVAKNTKVGSKAGSVDRRTDYIYIRIDGQLYLAHRLAWLYVHGVWPMYEIDHMQGTSNRISNLRDVPHAINVQNSRVARINSTTGFLGVERNGGRFVARIKTKGESLYLGAFGTPEEAHAVYVEAKRKLHEGNML